MSDKIKIKIKLLIYPMSVKLHWVAIVDMIYCYSKNKKKSWIILLDVSKNEIKVGKANFIFLSGTFGQFREIRPTEKKKRVA